MRPRLVRDGIGWRRQRTQLAECLALESRNNHGVHVTIRPPAVNLVMSVKLSGDMVAVSRGGAVREAEPAPERK
jgi:hypothetical protein